MSIHRHNLHSLQDPKFCWECGISKITGYWMMFKEFETAIFVCDDCLALAKKHHFIKDGHPEARR